ncbi:MAG TPA: adenylate/guanylate cyclase domain-containing protein [Micromonosporaceae bacterium]
MATKRDLPSGLVTFLFTDIEGSTRLAQLLGGQYRPMLAQHRQILRRALGASDGVAMFTEGDSVFAVFADANAAIRACIEGQRALDAHHWRDPQARPKVRMGLHSGHATPVAGEYATPEVHRAARVAAAAHGGQVLCSAATARLATDLPADASLLDLGLYQLRGFDGRERLFQLIAGDLERSFPRPRTLAAASHNLPASPSSFIGREVEREELAGLVASRRLVSVVGPGGAGKTRLAIEVAATMVPSCPDGVWFIDLAAVTDPYLISVAVAEVLGVRPEPGRTIVDTIVDFVAPRSLLLVLDTADAQLSAVKPLVTRLVGAGPGVRVLATSREPLAVPGEVVWRIPPLDMITVSGGATPDAVALLLDRATAARGGREPGTEEITHLHRVAQRLDGLPLALELAAARLRLFSAAQLADRLEDLLGTLDVSTGLTGEFTTVTLTRHRHSTLRATVDWSYRNLPGGAASLLRQLSVFAGAIDLPTVEWIAGPGAVTQLAVLVDKSLVSAEPGVTEGEVVYRVLDPIKAFGARALVQAGEEQAARDRHLKWVLHAVARVHTGVDGEPVTLSTYPIDSLAAEVRAALLWSVNAGRIRDGLRLAVLLDEWWRERGLPREGRLWLSRLFEKGSGTDEEIPAAELAAAYHTFSRQAGADGELEEQLRLLVEAEKVAWKTGQAAFIARVSACRGDALQALGREDEAERACREAIEWARNHNVEAESLPAVFCLAQMLWRRGRLVEAATELGAARAVASTHPTERGRRSIDMLLGMVALSRGDLIAAHDHVVVALRARMAHGYHWAATEALTAMAVRCALGGEMTQAATLFGASQAARSRLKTHRGVLGPMGQRHESAVRHIMGDVAFDEAYAAGAAMTLAEATTFALDVEHPDLAHALVRLSVDSDPTADLSMPTL